MGKTIIEKIIAARAERDVAAGETVFLALDVRSARDFGGANVVKNFRREYGDARVADVAKTFFTFDCVVPANTIPYANNQHICRLFAREQGIRVYDVDAGIGSHVMIEQGLVLPGSTVVGTDSHLNIMGAVGAFGQGMGDADIAFAFKTGRTWFEVPETIKLTLSGALAFPAVAKDLTLAVLKEFGSKGALGKVVEVYGDCVERLSLPERVTLASMGTEMGAIAVIIPPSQDVLRELAERSGKPCEPVLPDADAHYAEVRDLALGDISPQIALPGEPSNVVDVSDVAGKPVDSAFIGSCTNGRYEDFEAAAKVLKDGKVAAGVMAKGVPATKEVFEKLLGTGLFKKLFGAGFILSNQGCGGCASGQIGMTGKGEVQLSTSNRNFRGKQGAGDTYLCSPPTAAASAMAGRITDPRETLR
jgi:3-isopropylmalate/(R)-2-methylmalate dehydratase large subunit